MDIYAGDEFTVYDPFMGTGTTAIACINKRLPYVGSEISKRYVMYANERIKQQNKQFKLF